MVNTKLEVDQVKQIIKLNKGELIKVVQTGFDKKDNKLPTKYLIKCRSENHPQFITTLEKLINYKWCPKCDMCMSNKFNPVISEMLMMIY